MASLHYRYSTGRYSDWGDFDWFEMSHPDPDGTRLDALAATYEEAIRRLAKADLQLAETDHPLDEAQRARSDAQLACSEAKEAHDQAREAYGLAREAYEQAIAESKDVAKTAMDAAQHTCDEALQAEHEALEAERKARQAERKTFQAEREALEAVCKALRAEHEALEAVCKALKAKREACEEHSEAKMAHTNARTYLARLVWTMVGIRSETLDRQVISASLVLKLVETYINGSLWMSTSGVARSHSTVELASPRDGTMFLGEVTPQHLKKWVNLLPFAFDPDNAAVVAAFRDLVTCRWPNGDGTFEERDPVDDDEWNGKMELFFETWDTYRRMAMINEGEKLVQASLIQFSEVFLEQFNLVQHVLVKAINRSYPLAARFFSSGDLAAGDSLVLLGRSDIGLFFRNDETRPFVMFEAKNLKHDAWVRNFDRNNSCGQACGQAICHALDSPGEYSVVLLTNFRSARLFVASINKAPAHGADGGSENGLAAESVASTFIDDADDDFDEGSSVVSADGGTEAGVGGEGQRTDNGHFATTSGNGGAETGSAVLSMDHLPAAVPPTSTIDVDQVGGDTTAAGFVGGSLPTGSSATVQRSQASSSSVESALMFLAAFTCAVQRERYQTLPADALALLAAGVPGNISGSGSPASDTSSSFDDRGASGSGGGDPNDAPSHKDDAGGGVGVVEAVNALHYGLVDMGVPASPGTTHMRVKSYVDSYLASHPNVAATAAANSRAARKPFGECNQ